MINIKMIKIFMIIIILALLAFVTIFSFILSNNNSFTTLSNYYDKEILKNIKKPMKKGDKLYGEFIAKENNLGTISISFDPKYKSWDEVYFRLKEKSQNNWYYQFKYYAPQFIGLQYFPFGFPKIKESANKTYQFELESKVANKEEGVAINEKFPIIIVNYQFEKNELLSNPWNFISFVFKKITSGYSLPGFLFVSIVGLSPMLIYLVFLFNKGLSFKLIKYLSLLFILGDVFILRKYYILILSIIILMLFFDKNTKKLLYMLNFLLFILPIVLLTGRDYFFYKAGLWFYIILVVLIIHEKLFDIPFIKRIVIS